MGPGPFPYSDGAMDLSALDYVLAAGAAAAAGMVNAVAGGGTLITFPTLIALGLPAVSSNVTNTVALCPGYIGGAFAQRDDLAGQARRVPAVVAAAAVGGIIGSILLVVASEALFLAIVPAAQILGTAVVDLYNFLNAAL